MNASFYIILFQCIIFHFYFFILGKEELRHKSSESWKGWPQGNEEQVQDTKSYAEVNSISYKSKEKRKEK